MPKSLGARAAELVAWLSKQPYIASTAAASGSAVSARHASAKPLVSCCQRVSVGRPRLWQLAQLPEAPTELLPMSVSAWRASSSSASDTRSNKTGGELQSVGGTCGCSPMAPPLTPPTAVCGAPGPAAGAEPSPPEPDVPDAPEAPAPPTGLSSVAAGLSPSCVCFAGSFGAAPMIVAPSSQAPSAMTHTLPSTPAAMQRCVRRSHERCSVG